MTTRRYPPLPDCPNCGSEIRVTSRIGAGAVRVRCDAMWSYGFDGHRFRAEYEQEADQWNYTELERVMQTRIDATAERREAA